MKIAGRKNDGAWFRMNKAINGLDADHRPDLIEGMTAATGLKAAAAFADFQALAAECGVAFPGDLADSAAWIAKMCQYGIPRQIWNGRLSFTTYGKVGTKYVANYQSNIHFFAKDLRRFCKYWLHGRRAINDLTDLVGALGMNPGGLPDANRPDSV